MSKGTLLVVGQGYVGLPIAMRGVEVGYTVVGLDTDAERVKTLAGGKSYVEDVPEALVSTRSPPGPTRLRPVSRTRPASTSPSSLSRHHCVRRFPTCPSSKRRQPRWGRSSDPERRWCSSPRRTRGRHRS